MSYLDSRFVKINKSHPRWTVGLSTISPPPPPTRPTRPRDTHRDAPSTIMVAHAPFVLHAGRATRQGSRSLLWQTFFGGRGFWGSRQIYLGSSTARYRQQPKTQNLTASAYLHVLRRHKGDLAASPPLRLSATSQPKGGNSGVSFWVV